MLCVHGTKHRWTRLQWIVDVGELIRARPDLDWTRVRDLAAASGTQRMLWIGLCLARGLAGAALPADVARAVEADSVAGRLVRQVMARLFDAEDVGSWRNSARNFLFQLRAKEGAGRLRYALRGPGRVGLASQVRPEGGVAAPNSHSSSQA